METALGVNLVSTRDASKGGWPLLVTMASSAGLEGSVVRGVEGVVMDGIVDVVPWVL